ncbi:MAG: HPF/RaiA family ribosome-associated protein [Bdellovibrionota bacterium]
MIPFHIQYLDFPESDAVTQALRKRIMKLDHYFKRIVRCDVSVSCPHRHRHADRLFDIQIHIALPGNDIIASRNPVDDEAHTDVYVAIRDAFDAAERMLRDKAQILRNEIKFHEKEERI